MEEFVPLDPLEAIEVEQDMVIVSFVTANSEGDQTIVRGQKDILLDCGFGYRPKSFNEVYSNALVAWE